MSLETVKAISTLESGLVLRQESGVGANLEQSRKLVGLGKSVALCL